MITRPRELLYVPGGEGETINRVLVTKCIEEFEDDVRPDVKKMRDYYNGKQDIAQRTKEVGKANNKISHNYPLYITTIASGYLLGSPVQYTAKDGQEAALEEILKAFKAAKIDSVDQELARDASVCGKGVELTYADESARVRSATLDPAQAFVVYDDTVQHKPLFGVHFYESVNAIGEATGVNIVVYTADMIYTLYSAATGDNNVSLTAAVLVSEEEHQFGGVPMVEYWNNEREAGDFATVVSQIDAYNVLQSDRVNDKEDFVDALLLIKGAMLEAETDEEGRERTSVGRMLKRDKLLMLPDADCDAEYLSNTMNEADNELLRKSLCDDIHKLSFIPDMSDERFSGNVSGVAMRYKLLALEMLTGIKERWYKEALQMRLELYSNFIAVKGGRVIDPTAVEIVMKRKLPVNDLETAQMVQTLRDLVPDELLLGQVAFVQDVDDAMDKMREQREESMKLQRDLYEMPTPDDQKDSALRDDDADEE